MRVAVGSQNNNKLKGVEDAFLRYYKPEDLMVFSADVHVEEFGHPKSLKETVEGAMRRAQAAFGDCDLAVGIESGLMEVPHTKTGYMESTICALYDGAEFYIGCGTAFEWPVAVTDAILNKGLDGSQAMREAGCTDCEKIGAQDGAIFTLTNGHGNRRAQVEQATITALVHIVHPEYYRQ